MFKLSNVLDKNENYAMLEDVTESQQGYLDMWFIIRISGNMLNKTRPK